MALPDFPDYHKWGFSLTALSNTVYVTGGQARLLRAWLAEVTPARASPPPAHGVPDTSVRIPADTSMT